MSVPTYEQVTELPAQTVTVVPSEYIDENGHMNIGRYFELGGRALWDRCIDELGMDEDYLTARGMSTFTAEHHLRYFAEILQGQEASVHVRLIARSDKVLHGTSLIVNRTTRRLACTMEFTVIHIDMGTRRPTPFPEDVAGLLDTALKADDLAWPAPVCGAMGVRAP
ncbi:thioesterase family protein [Aeromicrobium wangtongii]|uniref:Thioesterase family protein n=1 Tax=Aeromicrobium wangtongii TaxID=2969247 RepID=A0ABY5M6F7_9ACTN|nr:thioesterase family protein [Aeromicrobium wangtongii]MCD9200147.1 thioesterase family protein [Aeromicrobium wangtongii]UUP13402.1 thioesterase family protein [Aeromicrobium wangtongii]